MKKTLLLLALTLTNLSYAAIANSNYETRHQAVIEKAISTQCGTFRELTQVASTEEVIVIDQGIRDVEYKTVLTGLHKIDQNIFDTYTITVESEFADMYDHQSQNWGVYSAGSVTCVME